MLPVVLTVNVFDAEPVVVSLFPLVLLEEVFPPVFAVVLTFVLVVVVLF